MSDRYTYIGSAYLFLIQNDQILLQRRFQTGFMDGYYVVPAGRLDRNETAREGCVREIEEEIGIMIKSEMLEVVQVIHRKTEKDERIDFFMTTKAYTGEIKNKGPHKCDDLRWFKIDALPDNLVDYVRVALEHYRQHILYAEFGYN